jgi:hypothetical protein
MSTKFDLGKVIIKENAALVLAKAGQDADFFLAKHLAGDWGDGNAGQNEQALLEGSMLWSTYRTLRAALGASSLGSMFGLIAFGVVTTD